MRWKYGKGIIKGAGLMLAWTGVLVAVSTGGGLTYFLVINRPAEPVAVRLLTVERGNVETTINESGIIELREQRILKSPTEGAVEQVLVEPGEKVKSGQVLLTLRYPERKIALASQQLQIQQEELNLARTRQKIVETQEQLRTEEQELQNLASLVQEGAISRQQFQRQENALRTIRSTLRDNQTQAKTSALKLQSLRLQRQGIQQQLQDSAIVAPLNGIVLGIYVKDGDGVEFRTNLLSIGDPKKVLVKLQLSILNAARVQVNQNVRVKAIGLDARTFIGRVQSLYPQALTSEELQKQQGGSSQNQSTQSTVPTTVQLNTATRTLLPGSRVNVEIVLEQRKNVVVLSTETIQRSEPRPFVWVRDSQNHAQKRAITLGLEGLVTVEVTSGLRAGEQVILPTPELQLKPGMPVTPVQGIKN